MFDCGSATWQLWNGLYIRMGATGTSTTDIWASRDGNTWAQMNNEWMTVTNTATTTAWFGNGHDYTAAWFRNEVHAQPISRPFVENEAPTVIIPEDMPNQAPVILPGEALKRMREEEMAWRLKQEELYRIERENRASAEKRALELLVSALTPEQAACYQERSYFDLKCGETFYRIRKGSVRNIEVIKNNRTVKVLCAHPRENLPVHDMVLAQKLALEADEQAFLRVANVSMV